MADYWKSNPRKFCEFCKCWFSDNRASIEFHERGKRHQEAVRRRLDDIALRGRQQHEQQISLEKEMAAIEQAALKAVEKDKKRLISSDGSSVSTKTAAAAAAAIPAEVVAGPHLPTAAAAAAAPTPPAASDATCSRWHEAKSDEGHTYYWHIDTGESRWEPPAEGYVSLDDQKTKTAAAGVGGGGDSSPVQLAATSCPPSSQLKTNSASAGSSSSMYTKKAKVVFRQRSDTKLGSGMEEFKRRKLGPGLN